MYHVELYLRVRLACHRDGLSQREAARRFGIDRKTVAKILKHSVPPGYQRGQAPKRPKLDPYTGIIDQILEDDKSESKKQRHTCKRIFEWLRDEHGYSGGITQRLGWTTKPFTRSDRLTISVSRSGRMPARAR